MAAIVVRRGSWVKVYLGGSADTKEAEGEPRQGRPAEAGADDPRVSKLQDCQGSFPLRPETIRGSW